MIYIFDFLNDVRKRITIQVAAVDFIDAVATVASHPNYPIGGTWIGTRIKTH